MIPLKLEKALCFYVFFYNFSFHLVLFVLLLRFLIYLRMATYILEGMLEAEEYKIPLGYSESFETPGSFTVDFSVLAIYTVLRTCSYDSRKIACCLFLSNK